MWCVAELNEDYIAKMEDVLETYERPYDPQEPVICLDEKPVTLHADVRPASPAKPGRETRQDNEYERRGTANIFCAVEPRAGRHFTFATPDRSGAEFAKVAFELALQYPAARTIHLIVDNLNIHRRKSLTDRLGQQIGTECSMTICQPIWTVMPSTREHRLHGRPDDARFPSHEVLFGASMIDLARALLNSPNEDATREASRHESAQRIGALPLYNFCASHLPCAFRYWFHPSRSKVEESSIPSRARLNRVG